MEKDQSQADSDMRIETGQNLKLERETVTEGFVRKRCPKCGGNVYLDRDYYGWYQKCLQCAHTSDLNNIAEAREKINHGSDRLAS